MGWVEFTGFLFKYPLIGVPVIFLCVVLAIIQHGRETGAARSVVERSPRDRARGEAQAGQRIPKIAERLAIKLRGSLVPRTELGMPGINFELHGHGAQLLWGMSRPLTRVMVEMKDSPPGRFQIYSVKEGEEVVRRFGTKVVRVGDPQFDARFAVTSQPPELTAKIFRGERRQNLFSWIKKVPGWAEGRINLWDGALNVMVPVCLWNEGSVLSLVGLAGELVVAIAQADSELSGVSAEAARASGGECQVCGTELRERVVYCASCRTPHHAECWDYMERCSTYACAGTRAVSS